MTQNADYERRVADAPDVDDLGRCLACGNEVDRDRWCPCVGYAPNDGRNE